MLILIGIDVLEKQYTTIRVKTSKQLFFTLRASGKLINISRPDGTALDFIHTGLCSAFFMAIKLFSQPPISTKNIL